MRAGSGQVAELLAWADGVKPRTWAVESAGGMGYLLAQQLIAAGETVLDVLSYPSADIVDELRVPRMAERLPELTPSLVRLVMRPGKRRAQLGSGAAWDVFDAKALALEVIRAVAGNRHVRANAVANVSYLHPGVAG